MNDAALTQLDHAAQLDVVAAALSAAGHETALLDASDELPVTTLMLALDARSEDRPVSMAISIMPFGSDDLAATQLTQFYVPLPIAVGEESAATVQRAIAMVNAALAIGHFGMQHDEIFYRYVLASRRDDILDPPMVIEVIALLAFHQEHFADYLEGVANDEIALSSLPALLAEA